MNIGDRSDQGQILGFAVALLMMGSVREVLGYGTLLGVPLFGPRFEPWVIFALPPGGFLTLGLWLLTLSWWYARRWARRAAASAGTAPVRRAA